MNTLLAILIFLASGGVFVILDLSWIFYMAVAVVATIAIVITGRFVLPARYLATVLVMGSAFVVAAMMRVESPVATVQLVFMFKLLICLVVGAHLLRFSWQAIVGSFVKGFELLALLSLVTFVVLNLAPQSTVQVGSSPVGEPIRTLFGVGYLRASDLSKYGFVRNQGLFWEPGVLGFMAVLFTMLKLHVLHSTRRLWLYVLTILTTMSAGAIPLFMLVVGHYFYMKSFRDRLNQRGRLLADALLTILTVFLFTGLVISLVQPSLVSDLFLLVFGRDPLSDSSIATRSADIVYGSLAAFERPFFGFGNDLSAFYDMTSSEIGKSKEWYDGGITNSIVQIFYKYGALFLMLYLFLLWRLAGLVTGSGRLFAFMILVLMLMHEPLHFSLLMLFLLVYAASKAGQATKTPAEGRRTSAARRVPTVSVLILALLFVGTTNTPRVMAGEAAGNGPAAVPGEQFSLFPFVILQDSLAPITDFAALNRPLAAEDRVAVRGSRFVAVGRDGKAGTADDRRVKFFGANFAFGANFPTAEDARRIAGRLARLGFNAVRLVHLDTRLSNGQSTNGPEGILTDGPFPTLNHEAVSRLAGFIRTLGEKGIYVSLSLHVGYQFRPEVDDVPVVSGGMPRYSKPLFVFHPRMIALQEAYVVQVIKALGLKDNPVLAMVEISNEASLANAHATGSLKALDGEYRMILDGAVRQVNPTLSGISDWDQRAVLAALVALDRVYLDHMRAVIHREAGSDVPVGGTQMEFGGLANVDSHSGMDFLDSHVYADHFRFYADQPRNHAWRIYDEPIADRFIANIVARAFLRQSGKPFLVTEFNQPWPNSYGAEILPFMSVLASVQDWDGLFFFAYEHSTDWDRTVPAGFNLNGDAGKLAVTGSSAWLFRNGAVGTGSEPIEVVYDQLFRLDTSFGRSAAWRFDEYILKKYPDVDALLPLVRAIAARPGARTRLLTPPRPPVLESDTRQVRYWRQRSRLEVSADRVSIVLGRVSTGERADAGALVVQGADRPVVAMLVSRDGKALAHSDSMLLSLPGAVRDRDANSGGPRQLVAAPGYPAMRTFASLDEGAISAPYVGRPGPPLMEVFAGRVGIRCLRHFRAHALDGSGRRSRLVALIRDDGDANLYWLDWSTSGQPRSPWVELEVVPEGR